jgi:hypothetical protein
VKSEPQSGGGGNDVGSLANMAPHGDELAPKFQEDVTAASGTVAHWIQRSPLEQVLEGCNKGIEVHQLRLLKGKVDECQQNTIATHHENITLCRETWKDTLLGLPLSRNNYIVERLVKANIQWPKITQVNLFTYDGKDLFALKPDDSEPLQIARFGKICNLYTLWRIPDKDDVFDPTSVRLSSLGISDALRSKIFLDDFVGKEFCAKWVQAGETMKPIVLAFVSFADKAWELPDDATIDASSAQMLCDAKRALACIPAMMEQTVTRGMQKSVFEDSHERFRRDNLGSPRQGLVGVYILEADFRSCSSVRREICPASPRVDQGTLRCCMHVHHTVFQSALLCDFISFEIGLSDLHNAS